MGNACRSEAADGRGRCRNTAQADDRDGFCAVHAAMRDSGKFAVTAKMPNRVLIKVNVNPSWADRLIGLGIPLKTPDFARQDATHAAEAKAIGRDPNAVRPNGPADSGVPVFGKDGLSRISVTHLIGEMRKLGYRAIDAHIFQRRDKGAMNVLVITMADAGDEIELPQEVYRLLTSCFGFAHVWANPPKLDSGMVVHTVNLSHRSDESAGSALIFDNGLWANVA